ncbi:MAG: 23S rRNA (adenine(2503)-C(2))-methyltransferase RlmN [Bacteroidia bacterium]|nr:23S rRNA (adenine(2503)-C(2))-methyltransferase RlmN [Bacteroidia bacterium]
MNNNIFGYTLAELEEASTQAGLPRYRAEQLFYWLYNRRVDDFSEFHNVPRLIRESLSEKYIIRKPLVRKEQTSADGTQKFLFGLEDGRAVETVLIPAESDDRDQPRRLTICVSTQVGCPLDCRFCATASMKLKRNLTTGEIVGQYMAVQKRTDARITNLVFMGMGEPMLNMDNVMRAVGIITHEKTGGIAASRITLSTAGMVEGIRRMADEGWKIKLALSLHATTDDLRLQLMPINKKYPLAVVMDAIEYYYRKTRMRVTYEYILFNGLNDGVEDARRLVKIARRVPPKVNIIPFHPADVSSDTDAATTLEATPRWRIEEFADALRASNITVMLRSSSGLDIDAACGQLALREPASLQHPS